MDRIEELMKGADPASGLPAPGSLNLDVTNPDGSHAPTFVPTYVEAADDVLDEKPDNVVWFKRPAVWIAGVAAAAAVGLVIAINPFAPHGQAPLPGVTAPDATPMTSSTRASNAPSESAGSTTTSGSANNSASTSGPKGSTTSNPPTNSMGSLPNGLMPAHPSVFWEDTPECRAFDISKVMVFNPTIGQAEPLNGSPKDNPVSGCYGGYAAYVAWTDQVFYTQMLSDRVGGLFVAKWDGKQWLVDHTTQTQGTEGMAEVLTYPMLRSFPDVEGASAADNAKLSLQNIGVTVDDPEKLLGPNTATWAPTTPAGQWIDFRGDNLGYTGNQRDDWTLETRTAGQSPALVYEMRWFDQYGASAAMVTRHAQKPTATCDDPAATYRMDSSSNVRMLPKNDELLSVNLVTIKDAFGNETSSFKLLPRNTATTGKACDLIQTLDMADGTFLETTISSRFGFESAAERQEFLNSQYFKDMTTFAEGLTFQGYGQ